MNLAIASCEPSQTSTWFRPFLTAVTLISVVLAISIWPGTLVANTKHRMMNGSVHHRVMQFTASSQRYRQTQKSSIATTHQPAALHATSFHRDRQEQISPSVIRALRLAHQKVNADPQLLLAIASKESGFDTKARNRHSSARGLLQFTTATWLTVVRDFGSRHGLSRYADAIDTDRDGHLTVKTRHLRRIILALRDDPFLEAVMAAERLNHEHKALEGDLGHPVQPADLYFIHLLGPTGGTRFLSELAAHPDASSTAAVGSAANLNAGLFMKDGRELSLAEAYAGVQQALEVQTSQHLDQFQPKIASAASRP